MFAKELMRFTEFIGFASGSAMSLRNSFTKVRRQVLGKVAAPLKFSCLASSIGEEAVQRSLNDD